MSKLEDLEALGRMLDEGKIDRAEYERLKADLLAEDDQEAPQDPMERKPPGWYHDPSGTARHQAYWDGRAWTGQTRPSPPKPSPSSASKESSPTASRLGQAAAKGGWRVWLVVLVFVAIAIAIEVSSDEDQGSGEDVTAAAAGSSVEQIEWSISIGGTGTITLKGDLPNGYPTETWADGELLDRDPDGDFSWDLQSALPSPVSLIQQINDCSELETEFEFWRSGSDSAPSSDSAVRQLAFAQAALDRSESLNCP